MNPKVNHIINEANRFRNSASRARRRGDEPRAQELYQKAYRAESICFRYMCLYQRCNPFEIGRRAYHTARAAYKAERFEECRQVITRGLSVTSNYQKALTGILSSLPKSKKVAKPLPPPTSIPFNTRSLALRTIEGIEQAGKGIDKVRFAYPYQTHSFGIGDEIIWYFRGVWYQYTVQAINYKGNGIYLLTQTNDVLDVMDCFNAQYNR